MTGRFGPDELDGLPEAAGRELSEAMAAARELEAFAGATDVGPSEGFPARVMAALAAEPLPAPAAAAGLAARRGRAPAVLAAFVDSWRVAFGGGRPLGVRLQAFALVLAVLVAVGSLGSLAVVGSWNALVPARSPELSPIASPTAPSPTPSPSPTPTPSATPVPTPTPTETLEPTGTPDATEMPTATGDGAGSGGITPTATPRPTSRPSPSPTHEDSHTPEPTQTPESGGGGEDHGGSTPTPGSGG